MDGKLTPEELAVIEASLSTVHESARYDPNWMVVYQKDISRLLAHIAALEAELAAEVNARHALEDTMEQFAERVSKAEADKQIFAAALELVPGFRFGQCPNEKCASPTSIYHADDCPLGQALSRIEEK
jgi:hypothetical protein